jgi:hypothetical protein
MSWAWRSTGAHILRSNLGDLDEVVEGVSSSNFGRHPSMPTNSPNRKAGPTDG